MSDHARLRVANFIGKAKTVVTEPEVLAALHGLVPDAVRQALDDLVARGEILRWNRHDGVPGWSSIFQALGRPKDWTIETAPLDEESLQDELLALEPFSFTEFVESVLRRQNDVQAVTFSGADWNYDLIVVDTTGHKSYLVTKRVRTTNERRVREALDSRSELRAKDPAADVVLVVPGVVTEKPLDWPSMRASRSGTEASCWQKHHLRLQSCIVQHVVVTLPATAAPNSWQASRTSSQGESAGTSTKDSWSVF